MRNTISLLFLLLCIVSNAQDARFYQYEMNDLFLNPALTGDRLFQNKGIQINSNYHSNSSKNLMNGDASALGLGMDAPLTNNFSVGQYFGNNRSFDGSFNTFNYFASVSYKIISSNMFDDRHMLAIGMQLGVVNHSLNTKRLYYASQYSPFAETGFDMSMESGEKYAQQSFYKLDNNVGVVYRYKNPEKRYALTSGFAMYHLAKSSNKMNLGDLNEFRTNVHVQFHYDINDKMGISPHVLYTKQGITSDFNIGSFYQYNIHPDISPMIGLNLITKKASVVQLGLRYLNSLFKVSYAVALKKETRFINNGIELAYVHTFSTKRLLGGKSESKEEIKTAESTLIVDSPMQDVESYYMLKLKLIVDRLDVLLLSKEISKYEIQSELDHIIEELRELSKNKPDGKYIDNANALKIKVAEKLKLLEIKVHQ